MPIITIKNLTKTYQSGKIQVKALRGVDLQIERGEFTAITGASGSGKTTLLNLIGGLERPTTGTVQVGDTLLSTMPRKALIRFRLHQIGFVFQAYNLVPVLTVAENIALTMQLQGISSQQIKQRITEVIAQVGLSDKYHTRPAELSGGQQQRVAIARALATHPQFILADEPTASLDSATAADILGLMQTLNETEGVTFLFSTHDSRIMQRAKRIIELEDGQIKQIESM